MIPAIRGPEHPFWFRNRRTALLPPELRHRRGGWACWGYCPGVAPHLTAGQRRRGRSVGAQTCGSAGGGERCGADVGHLVDVVLDNRVLDVVLGERARVEDRRRDTALVGGGLRLPAVRQRDRALCSGLGLGLDRLVDRHCLVA